MRLESTREVKPGSIVAKPLYDDRGQVLLNAGVVLTEKYLQALQEKGYNLIYVSDPSAPFEVEVEEDISPECRVRATAALAEAFDRIGDTMNELRGQSAKDFKEVCSSEVMQALIGPHGPLAKIPDIVSEILDEVLSRATLAGLVSIRNVDTALYGHSIDVCVVAIMIGRAVGLPNLRMIQLAAGCLLHDIGKIFVDHEADPERAVREHTVLGFELLRSSPDPDILAPHVAYEHHEHQDGTGLPRGLEGTNTIKRRQVAGKTLPTLIGEIAAVANTYDNLLSGRYDSPGFPPDEALRELHKHAGTKLNKAIVDAFFHVVPVYPLGLEVLVRGPLFMNYTGIVTEINPAHLDRPVITLVYDNRGRRVPPEEIDLNEDRHVHIRCKTLNANGWPAAD